MTRADVVAIVQELLPAHDEYVSAKEAARLLGIGESTSRQRAKAAGLKRYRIGSAVRYRKSHVLVLPKLETPASDVEAKAEQILRRAK